MGVSCECGLDTFHPQITNARRQMIQQLLADSSNIFERQTPHKSGVVRFQLRNIETGGPLIYGASIYVQPNDQEVRIRAGALENGRFWLSNRKLHDFVRSNASAIIGSIENPSRAYVLRARHVPKVIRIIKQSHRL